MNTQDRFKRWFKLRFAILYPFGIFVLIFAHSDDQSIKAGIWFILAGLFIRIWANGYAVKLDKLTTSGPYAFVRHPLYFGTMFVAIGFVIMLRMGYIGVLLILVMVVVYSRTMKKEEQMLQAKFRDLYINYKKKVPAILPSVFPYRDGEKWPFSFRRLIKSQEYKLFIWMMIIVIVFHLKEELLVEHEKINTKIIVLIATVLFLGIIDFMGELLKWKKIEI